MPAHASTQPAAQAHARAVNAGTHRRTLCALTRAQAHAPSKQFVSCAHESPAAHAHAHARSLCALPHAYASRRTPAHSNSRRHTPTHAGPPPSPPRRVEYIKARLVELGLDRKPGA
eukprot:275121-Pleurochrysis_carterae.AAC.1